eukprot:TRINITY_DN7671_c0_g1_i1.p3 TRINITY_DN7671_c0_g1~~TRINITY_DN7671_c0_g1_i1.p3  ORF type:complete len:114 (-),score=23.35 TRINITY_DN7671_c0_g1_i1:444-785(-)
MSGAGRVTGQQGEGERPEETRNRRGERAAGRVKPNRETTRPRAEQSLEAEASSSGSRFRSVRMGPRNGMGAALPDEGRKAARGEKPLNGREPWTWLPDETSRWDVSRSKPPRD